MIESKPAVVRRLVTAVRDALLATRAAPQVGLAAMQGRLGRFDRTRALRSWKATQTLAFDGDSAEGLGRMDDVCWQRTIAHHAAVHGAPVIEPAAVYDSSFV